jgi:hypothetical protein
MKRDIDAMFRPLSLPDRLEIILRIRLINSKGVTIAEKFFILIYLP